mmetsp:Transcript_12154/g.27315  ORF Transcript_12154/g.27315 Transcript_12154/m.27315 type:complete len:83 (-) Transcript_12154:132-380(-)
MGDRTLYQEEEELGTSALVQEKLIEDDPEDYEDEGDDDPEDNEILEDEVSDHRCKTVVERDLLLTCCCVLADLTGGRSRRRG